MQTISYISNASQLSPEEIEEVLINAKINNNKKGINGVLIYVNETFFQVIEGSQHLVETLFEKIQKDQRHFNVLKVFETKTCEKKFSRFNSNYITFNEESATVELLKFLDTGKENNPDLHNVIVNQAKILLKNF
ncbi:BLUF domain-containing protein [Aquimarina aquimarini]|uniref:BLUF domain-containing protein n=1 Tax=Aquimarina aquimarini TaxID=1191734 RepID=UPI00131F0937|nr:BLUF domain-containing protein [Aquimarina aquimarini]